MQHRALGFASLLAVIGVSIVFGMLLGGRLNSPPPVLAAPEHGAIQLAPAATSIQGMPDLADIVERAMPAVVSVTSTHLGREEDDERGSNRGQDFFRFFFGPDGPNMDDAPQDQPRMGEGSGFIISSDGYVLTNFHVVDEADRVRIALQTGVEYPAEVVGTDPSIDLALLKVDAQGASLPTVPLGDSEGLRVGEWVIAIGNPLDYEHTVTVGVVSAKQRRVPIGRTDGGVVSFIQTDAAINFGNSGGPLIDSAGNVVGINTAIRRANYAEGIGFALPVNHARSVLDQLRERGYVKRGYIGITMNQNGIDDAAREYFRLPDEFGVIVDEVTADGPAKAAGLRDGDIIRKVDGKVVRDNLDLISKISSKQPGDAVNLEVFRNGRTLRMDATLADRQEQLDRATNNDRSPNRPVPEPLEESSGMGITVRTLDREQRERWNLDSDMRGVVVTDVEFGSEAADKNILRNMIIVGVNDEPIRNTSDWEAALDGIPRGSPIKLGLVILTPSGPRNASVFLRAP